MSAKTTLVTLVAGEVTREFEFSHAERILRMPRSGWALPEGSKFEYSEEYGLRRIKHTKED